MNISKKTAWWMVGIGAGIVFLSRNEKTLTKKEIVIGDNVSYRSIGTLVLLGGALVLVADYLKKK